MSGILLGNLTVEDIIRRTGCEFTAEEIEFLKNNRVENIEEAEKTGKLHFFDIPFAIAAYSKEMKDAVIKMFEGKKPKERISLLYNETEKEKRKRIYSNVENIPVIEGAEAKFYILETQDNVIGIQRKAYKVEKKFRGFLQFERVELNNVGDYRYEPTENTYFYDNGDNEVLMFLDKNGNIRENVIKSELTNLGKKFLNLKPWDGKFFNQFEF